MLQKGLGRGKYERPTRSVVEHAPRNADLDRLGVVIMTLDYKDGTGDLCRY